MSLSYNADDFTDQWMIWTIERMDFETRSNAALKNAPSPVLPEPLKSTGHKYWIPFWRQFTNYCQDIRGTLNIPITYVFRDDATPETNLLSNEYDSTDEALSACVALSGTYYNEDNAHVWGILEGLTCNGNAYPFIKKYGLGFGVRVRVRG